MARGSREAAGRSGGKGAAAATVSIHNIAKYRDYVFGWFSEVAVKLCTGKSLEEFGKSDVGRIIRCIDEEISRVKGRGGDPCAAAPLMVTGNDPWDKMNLCYAQKALDDFLRGEKLDMFSLPPAVSPEFAEHTRSFMGTGRLRRELFKIDGGVLALSIVGVHLSYSYSIPESGHREYGYVYVDVPPHMVSLDSARKINSIAASIVGSVRRSEGSVNSILLGIAVAISISLKELMADVVKRGGYAIANYLRIASTRNKAMIKGFDSVDVIHLARIVRASRTSGAIYRLLRKYPSKDYGSLRRFIETLSVSMLKYSSYRKPQYLYDVLRYLTSDELQREGAEWYGVGGKSGKELDWRGIVDRLYRLSNLVG